MPRRGRQPTLKNRMTYALDGRPQTTGGRKPRTPEPTTPAMDERQTKHFNLHIQGLSIPRIQEVTGASRETIMLDIQMEGTRRATERAATRSADIEGAVQRCLDVITRSLTRMQRLQDTGYDTREEPDPANPGKMKTVTYVRSVKAVKAANDCEKTVLQAQKTINKILGLEHVPDAPAASSGAAGPLVVLFQTLAPDQRVEMLRTLKARAVDVGATLVQRGGGVGS